MIKVTSLNKYFNKNKSNQIHVINDVNITLPDTGIVSFLGHSGSGKTTLLNVIGGLDRANGTIEYDDFSMKNYQASKIDSFRSTHIGYVFQNYNLLLNETVYDNLRIALDLIGINDKEEVDKRIEYTLKAVGLFKARKKKAYALSGGQQQRVSIARALLKNCRILIADEPTGNLDSSNTIEVMNILKKISKTTLVLLVTHEQNIADFYSDYIIRISDGKVVGEEKNAATGSLERDESSIAYLKDMQEVEGSSPLGSIKIYHEDGVVPANLTFIIKNNTIYLQSDQPIKLANDSALKIIDDHKKEIKNEEINNFEYDTSFYQDKKVKRNIFKLMCIKLKDSYLKFKHVNKRMRFMYFALSCIGFVFAISVLSFGNYSHFNTDNLHYSRSYSTLTEAYWNDSITDTVKEAYDAGAIDHIVSYSTGGYTYDRTVTLAKSYTVRLSLTEAPYYEDMVTLECGKAPENINDAVISLNVANQIVKNVKYDSLNDLLGTSLICGNYGSNGKAPLTIVGVSNNDNNFIHFHKQRAAKNLGSTYYGNRDIRYGEIEKKYNTYTVKSGSDLDLASSTKQVLVPVNYLNNVSIGETIELGVNTYTVVGGIEYEFPTEQLFIVNNTTQERDSITKQFSAMNPENGNYKITSGRDIQGKNEVLVSEYVNVDINQTYEGKTIVGKYIGCTSMMYQKGVVCLDEAAFSDYNYSFLFREVDSSKAKEIFNKAGLGVGNSYTLKYNEALEENNSNKLVYEILFIALFAISTIFIYLIMRSKMMADITTLGIYRSLGMKRHKVVGRYISDSLVLSFFTTIVGYYVCVLGYWFIKTMVSVLDEEILILNWWITIGGSFVILIISTILGVLPIALLVTRTPAEIMAKYDI